MMWNSTFTPKASKPKVRIPKPPTPRKPRPKTCKECGEKFTPAKPMQVVCGWDESPSCATKYAQRMKERQERNKAIKDRRETKKKLEDMATIPDLKKRVEKSCHAFIRERDKNQPCVSCGSTLGSKFDAGHFRSRGSADHLRYDERNIHAQCVHCNQHLGGNYNQYALRLPHRIGQAAFDSLVSDNALIKWTREILLELDAKFKRQLKELKGR